MMTLRTRTFRGVACCEYARSPAGPAFDRDRARSRLPVVLPRRAAAAAHLAAPAGPGLRAGLAAVPAEPRHAERRHVTAGLRDPQIRRRGAGTAAVFLDRRDRPVRRRLVPLRADPPDAVQRGRAPAGAL